MRVKGDQWKGEQFSSPSAPQTTLKIVQTNPLFCFVLFLIPKRPLHSQNSVIFRRAAVSQLRHMIQMSAVHG